MRLDTEIRPKASEDATLPTELLQPTPIADAKDSPIVPSGDKVAETTRANGEPETVPETAEPEPPESTEVPAEAGEGAKENVALQTVGQPPPFMHETVGDLGYPLGKEPRKHCYVTNKSHSGLVEWGLHKCPECQEPLLDQPEAPVPIVRYKVDFLYDDGNLASSEPWTEPFSVEAAQGRKKVATVRVLPVLEVCTEILTDVKNPNTAGRAMGWGYPENRPALDGNKFLECQKTSFKTISTSITIYSFQLLQTIRRLVAYYPGQNLVGDSILIQQPYTVIVHHLEELEAYQKTYIGAGGNDTSADLPSTNGIDVESCDEETYTHINILREFIDHSYKQKVEEERRRYLHTPAIATFSMLWLMLKPGSTVYTEIHGSYAACVIESVKFRGRPLDNKGSYDVNLWYLDFDGRHLGRRAHFVTMNPFDGEREILNLKVIPVEFYDKMDNGKMRDALVQRGQKFYDILEGAQMDYTGNSLGDPIRWYEGKVIVDVASYYSYRDKLSSGAKSYFEPHFDRPDKGDGDRGGGDPFGGGGCNCEICRPGNLSAIPKNSNYEIKVPWESYDNIDPKKTASLDLPYSSKEKNKKHRYLLCSKKVIGFILKSRKWEALNIECCNYPMANTKAIDNLVMSDEKKILIKALVHQYTDHAASGGKVATPWSADFIRNKGEGQIFLLHGSPGVGKTYTAECIAEATGRPLLALTCGDIGTDEVKMEDQLSKWFRLAEIWGAVMLFDEADVYLEKRLTSDLQRNSLVSVFLRTMEYYRGILFLTTNRVGQFDDAFISRIHVVIHYADFQDSERERIWMNFFKKLEDERKDIQISQKVKRYVLTDPEMKGIKWNGREIRNAFQTAVALADYRFAMQEPKEEGDGAELKPTDFEKVCEMAGAFKNYLNKLALGLDEAQRAEADRNRNDSSER